MQKELLKFIIENNLSPFNSNKTSIKNSDESIFKTKDAKAIFNKVLSKISSEFYFKDTECLLESFNFTNSMEEIEKRQTFFSTVKESFNESNFLELIKEPKQTWTPKYEIVTATSNEKTFIELKKLGCPVKFITSEEDVKELENYDIVQVVDCEEFTLYLEQLNQTVFINNVEDAYLERYLELLSGWKKNLEVLNNLNEEAEIRELSQDLSKLLCLTGEEQTDKIVREEIEEKLELINEKVSEKIKTMSMSGAEVFEMLSKSSLSKEITDIIDEEIKNQELEENSEIFIKSIPVTIDEKELGRLLKDQDSNEFVSISEKIKRNAREVKLIPERLNKIENLILLQDFYSGIRKFIVQLANKNMPSFSEDFLMEDSSNIFLENAQPISFLLSQKSKWSCSILTGANSGGKTTLLEHIIQLISLFQLGMPVSGKVKMPVFEEIYYFAKNKGSISKGAFETLLTQMSKIIPGNKTLILADEIESVTEPGVAGKILCSTSEYFIKKNCFLVIATHLGQEIKNHLPEGARIDGIEAKGLDENYELIVNHNPVLGRLAHSTPELIIEKMANSQKTKTEYIQYIFEKIKKQ